MTEIHPSMTLRQAIEPWLESRRAFISARTYSDYNHSKKPLLEFLGPVHLKDITPGMIRQYQMQRLQRCGGTSINHECCILQQILKRVGCWKDIMDDYQPIPLPDLGPGKSLTAQEEEVWFRAAAIKPGWRVAYLASMVSINTSAGPGEMLNLKLKNLRLSDDPPSIQILNGTKNKYRIRHVPLNDKAKWAAEQLLARAKELGSTDPEHYLIPFRTKTNTYDPLRPGTNWRGAHEEICATAGLSFRRYDLRHTAITRMLESGVPEGTVMAVCGHISRAMVQRYSHIQMKSKLAAVQRILGGDASENSNAASAKKLERKNYLRVMVNCSASMRLVFTGMAVEEKVFRREGANYSSVFTCPECRQPHQWAKPDAFLLP